MVHAVENGTKSKQKAQHTKKEIKALENFLRLKPRRNFLGPGLATLLLLPFLFLPKDGA